MDGTSQTADGLAASDLCRTGLTDVSKNLYHLGSAWEIVAYFQGHSVRAIILLGMAAEIMKVHRHIDRRHEKVSIRQTSGDHS